MVFAISSSFHTEASQNLVPLNADFLKRLNSSWSVDRQSVNQAAHSVLSQLESNKSVKPLADQLLAICSKKKIASKELNILDHALHAQDHQFQTNENKADFVRWQKWGLDQQVYLIHHDFAKYLLESPLGNQMKIFVDPIIMRDGLPGILVEGEWSSYEALQERFEIKFLPEYREKFMVEKATQRVFTFLGNGAGLQHHHPYKETSLKHPITRLTEEEYERTLEVAQRFRRDRETEADPNRTFIFQIVSSYITDSQNNNAMELLYRRQHPWIRVICGRDNEQYGTKKGDVFEIGFNRNGPRTLPGKTTRGRFRTEDLWNYNTKTKQRVVTNIPISPEEAEGMLKYILEYHLANIDPKCPCEDKVAFNLLSQNCTAFVHYLAKQAGIRVPTKIFLTDLIQEISPNWLKAIGRVFKSIALAIKAVVKTVSSWTLPKFIRTPISGLITIISKLVRSIMSFIVGRPLQVVSVTVGNGLGETGRAFTDSPERKATFGSRFWKLKNLFTLRTFYYHLPGVLQGWQREQASTVIYENPVKLSVVPPNAPN